MIEAIHCFRKSNKAFHNFRRLWMAGKRNHRAYYWHRVCEKWREKSMRHLNIPLYKGGCPSLE